MIASPESKYIADGSILRGNLLLRNGQLEDAAKVFQGASGNYGPVRDKLDKVLVDHPDTAGVLPRSGARQYRGVRREYHLASRGGAICQAKRATSRAPSMCCPTCRSRARWCKETALLIRRLDDATAIENRASIFPDLRLQRERTTGLRNRAALVRKGLINAAEEKSLRFERRNRGAQARARKAGSDPQRHAHRGEELHRARRAAARWLSRLVSRHQSARGRAARDGGAHRRDRALPRRHAGRAHQCRGNCSHADPSSPPSAVPWPSSASGSTSSSCSSRPPSCRSAWATPATSTTKTFAPQYIALVERERSLLGVQGRDGGDDVQACRHRRGHARYARQPDRCRGGGAHRIDEAGPRRRGHERRRLSHSAWPSSRPTPKTSSAASHTPTSPRFEAASTTSCCVRTSATSTSLGRIAKSTACESSCSRANGRARFRRLDDEFQEIMDEPKGGEQ